MRPLGPSRRPRCAGRCGPTPACAKPPSGSCQGRPAGRALRGARSRRRRRGRRRGPRRGGRSTARRPATYDGWAVSRARSSKPQSSVTWRSRSSEGHGRSGFTWSGVSGETPPQSSTPAPSRARHSSRSTRLGGACSRTFGPSTIRATASAATYSSRPRSSTCRIAVSGLARKFWTMTSCTWPYCRATRRSAKIDSARSVERLADADQQAGGERDREPAGVLEHPQAYVGVLVGRAEVGLALRPRRAGARSSPASSPSRARPA